MNIFVRFGQWLEKNRVVRMSDWDEYVHNWTQALDDNRLELNNRISALESEKQSIQAQSKVFTQIFCEVRDDIDKLKVDKQIPATLAKDLAIIRQRLDKLELLTGLKRDPGPVPVPGASRIS